MNALMIRAKPSTILHSSWLLPTVDDLWISCFGMFQLSDGVFIGLAFRILTKIALNYL